MRIGGLTMRSLMTNEVITYQNFEMLMKDILDLASQIMPEKTIYINSLNDFTQVTLKVSSNDNQIHLQEGTTIPVEQAICNRIDYTKGAPLIYEDIRREIELDTVKSTIDALNIGAYLGIPITLKNGSRFGTLCAASSKANQFDPKSVELLQKLAKMFSYYLELEYLAYRDSLTGILNRQHLYRFFDDAPYEYGALLMVDLDNFKQINDTFGHDKGNQILQEFSKKLEDFTKLTKYGYPTRLGGDEFVVVLPLCDNLIEVEHKSKVLLESLKTWDTPIGDVKLTASIGGILYKKGPHTNIRVLLKEADFVLYEAKNLGKNTYKIREYNK